jgi:bacterioferritin-associated ferredoxin
VGEAQGLHSWGRGFNPHPSYHDHMSLRRIVSDKEIRECRSLDEAIEKHEACTGCGSCMEAVIEIIEKEREAQVAEWHTRQSQELVPERD